MEENKYVYKTYTWRIRGRQYHVSKGVYGGYHAKQNDRVWKAHENAHELNRMTKIEKEEFIKRMKGMSREELELVVEIVPIDLCLRRINNEIDRLRTFEDSVKSAVSGLSQ